MNLQSTTLDSSNICLIPLQREHANALVLAASDGYLWELWYTSVPSAKTVEKYIETALEQKGKGQSLPFVVIDKSTDKVIGSTRYCNIQTAHRRLEIGYTWYAKSYQRTHVNSQCKLLLLTHAFESLQVIAVEFRTHWHNMASRKAIARLGAKQDGVLRKHQILADGTIRDTVVFSITDTEWPAVKKQLKHRLIQG